MHLGASSPAPTFSPAAMAEYFRQVRGHEFTAERVYEMVSGYESDAEVIQGYLDANGMGGRRIA